MAYVTKLEDDNEQNQYEPTVQLSEAGGTNQNMVQQGGMGNKPSRPQTPTSFVSGQTYLQGNKQAADKLAQRLFEPALEAEQKAGESLTSRLNEFKQNVQQAIPTNTQLIDKAIATPSQLTPEERAEIMQRRTGEFKGPQQAPEFDVARQQYNKASEIAKMFQTPEGVGQQIKQQTAGQRYTPGMMQFDAMTLRQSPRIREQFEAQQQRAANQMQQLQDAREQSQLELQQAREQSQQYGEQLSNRLQQAREQQEQTWQDLFAQRQQDVEQVQRQLAQEGNLTPEQLSMLGMSQEQYDRLRNARIPTRWDLDYNAMANLIGPERAQKAVDQWHMWDLPFQQQFLRERGVHANPVYTDYQGYNQFFNPVTSEARMSDVVTPEQLQRYNALVQLQGQMNPEWVPAQGREQAPTIFDTERALQELEKFIRTQSPNPNY